MKTSLGELGLGTLYALGMGLALLGVIDWGALLILVAVVFEGWLLGPSSICCKGEKATLRPGSSQPVALPLDYHNPRS